jgi:CRP/FNR family cyclic AMP-dependent transcriptional regulator
MPRSNGYSEGQLARRLKTVSILNALSLRQLTALAKDVEVQDFDAGQTVVKHGAKGDGLFLILQGSVAVRRGGRVLAKLSAGQFFGEMSLFDNEPRSADVVTVAPSKLAVLQKWQFWGFASAQPQVVLSVLEEMSRRLRAANEVIAG